MNLSSVTIITGFIFIVSATSAFAYYYQYGYNLHSIPYKVENSTGAWYFQEAAKHWKNAVGTNIYETGSSNRVELESSNHSWYGLYNPNIIGGKAASFRITVNSKKLAQDFGDGKHAAWEAIVSTAVHESGHAQYLDDYKKGSGMGKISIMSHERVRTTMYKPQTHDINNIRNLRK